MSRSNRSSDRRGFTLVELLVVITIIGILVSLLVPTLAAAVKKSREGAIALEIKQLESAMESFRLERIKKPDVYPPDFSQIDPATGNPRTLAARGADLATFVRQMARNAGRTYATNWMQSQDNSGNNVAVFQAPIFGTVTPVPADLDPAEALVFWLSMTQKNPQAPLPSSGSRPAGPGFLPPSGTATWAFYEFNESRLVDQDNDGWPEYLQAHGEETPYVYFRDPGSIYDGTTNGRQKGIARPYFVSRAKIQIIAAGYDGIYSTYQNAADIFDPTMVRRYPTGVNFTEDDLDNLANFSDGRLDNELD